MLQVSKDRDEYIDCVKAIGIGLVVLGHSFGGGLLALKLYHMPLFFFISGLLLNDEERINNFIIKRIKRLYIPFLIYEVFFLCIHNSLYMLGILSNRYVFQDFISQLIHIVCFDNCEILLSPIWFVTVMFFSSIVSKIIIFYYRRWQRPFLLLGLCAFLIYSGMLNGREGIFYIKYSFNCQQVINVSLIATGYMLAGYLYKNGLFGINWRKSGLYEILVILVILGWGGLIIFERVTRLASDMRANTYTYISLTPLFAFIGIAAVFIIARYMLQILKWANLNKIKQFIIYNGEHTFSIMCLHPLAFKLVGLVQINFFGYDRKLLLDWGVVGYDVLWLTVDCIMGMLIPLMCSFCIKKILNIMPIK